MRRSLGPGDAIVFFVLVVGSWRLVAGFVDALGLGQREPALAVHSDVPPLSFVLLTCSDVPCLRISSLKLHSMKAT